MTRMSKQGERRHKCPHKRKSMLSKKTGPQKDNLALGYKEHINAAASVEGIFVPKIR